MRKADKVRCGIEQAKKDAEETRRTGLEAQKRDREIRERNKRKKEDQIKQNLEGPNGARLVDEIQVAQDAQIDRDPLTELFMEGVAGKLIRGELTL